MPRVPEITDRNLVAEDLRHNFDSIVESRGRVGGPFAVLMNSPEAAGRIAHIGTYLRFDNKLAPPLRELAIIAAVREWDCAPEWSAHVALARNEGVSEATIATVGAKGPIDSLAEEERTIVQYVRDLIQTRRVSDATFAAAHAMLGDQGITDLTATTGYYCMIACALNAFEVEAPAGAIPLP